MTDNKISGNSYSVTGASHPVTTSIPRLPTGSIPNASVGSGDLSSFPDPMGYIAGPSRGTGSLVGPDHPIFQQDCPERYPDDGGSFSGLPEARYDPIFPVTGPNADWNGPGRGVRGRGRGRFTGIPGEPNPDHLKPK